MKTYDDWLKVYSEVYDAIPRDPELACPNCGHHTLQLVFTGNPERGVGHGAFWCDTCLQGINTCRSPIPEGATVRDDKLPPDERLPEIPNFRLVH
jgi:hypothetical protein